MLHRIGADATGGEAPFIVYGKMTQSPFHAAQIETGVK
jgi:hypothetical protein